MRTMYYPDAYLDEKGRIFTSDPSIALGIYARLNQEELNSVFLDVKYDPLHRTITYRICPSELFLDDMDWK